MLAEIHRIFKNRLKYLAVAISLLYIGLTNETYAQNCIEPTRITPLYQCNYPRFEPVCGCDGVTYRNQCDAYWVHGVNEWSSGVCAGVAVDVYPNPVLYNNYLNITIQFPEFIQGNVTMYVVDMYAKVRLQRIFSNRNRIDYAMETYTFPAGVYFLLVTTDDGFYEYVKFIKG